MTLQTPTDASRGTQTPAQVAALLGVHTNTVRAWCSEYSEVLSDGARRRPRVLSASDVAVMQLVQSLRAEGLSRSAVLDRLRQTPTADLQQPWLDAAPTQPTDSPTETPTAPLAPLDVSAMLTAIVDSRTEAHAETLRSVDARLQRLEAQRTLWVGVAVGLVAGLVLGVIAAAVLLRG